MDGIHSRTINFEKLCRLCLQENRILLSIYDSVDDDHSVGIREKIMACAKVDLSRDDGLPARICIPCLSSLNAAFEFRLQCEHSDKTLHLLIDNQLQKETETETGDDDIIETEDCQELDAQLECVNFKKIIIFSREEKETQQSDGYVYLNEEEKGSTNSTSAIDLLRKSPVDNVDNISEKDIDFNESLAVELRGKETEDIPQFEVSVERPPELSGMASQDNRETTENVVEKKAASDVKKSSCPFCQKMLIRVNEHIRLLHRNKVYVCKKPDCSAEFPTLKNLQSHQLRCYDMKKPYKCLKCSKEFYRKCNYKAHARRHSDRKEFQCQLCEKAFVDSTGLRRHFLKHHAAQQEVYLVGCCGKKFKSKRGLKQHVQRGICGVQILRTVDSQTAVT